jgi:hypothetical protein
VCVYKVGEILRGESQHERIASNLRDGAYFYEDVSIFRVHCSTWVLIARMNMVGSVIVLVDEVGRWLHVDLGGRVMMSRLNRRPR